MQMLGHYEIRGVLGVGSMGRVYAGFDTHLERTVAIKTLKPELAEDPDFIGRFQAEAKNLAKLFHPNITTLLSTDLDRPDPYMVMEYVDGLTLEEILGRRTSPLSLKKALAIISQAADGISYAHERGVVHRDLKPSNIKISTQGTIKIMDFGIARIRGSSRMTRIGTAVGTPLYMSPEQCMGKEGDERSDVYSLAVIFYEMITGSTPFAAPTEYEILKGHIDKEPEPPSRTAGTPSKIDRVLAKALNKRPDDRYSTVNEFSQALGTSALAANSKAIVQGPTQLLASSNEVVHERPPRNESRDEKSFTWRIHPAYLTLLFGISLIGIYTFYKINPRIDKVATEETSRPSPQTAASRQISRPTPVEQEPINQDSVSHVPEETFTGHEAGLETLREAINGSKDSPVKASDFEFVTNGVKTRLLDQARELASTGNAEGLFIFGMLLAETPGHSDPEKAITALTEAAEKDYPDAQANLGIIYQSGTLGTNRSFEKARYWFQKGADNRDAKSLFWLACYHQFGWGGILKNRTQAAEQFKQAAELGYKKAAEASDSLAGTSKQKSPCISSDKP